jgi:hypothetical protein
MSMDLSAASDAELLAEIDRRTALLRAKVAEDKRRETAAERQRRHRASVTQKPVTVTPQSVTPEENVTPVTQKPVTETPPSPAPLPDPLSPPAPTPTHVTAAGANDGQDDGKIKLPDGSRKSRPDSLDQVTARCIALGLPASDAEAIWCKWEGNGFTNDRKPMKNWHSVIRSWQLHGYLPSQKPSRVSSLNASKPNGTHHSTTANIYAESARTAHRADKLSREFAEPSRPAPLLSLDD